MSEIPETSDETPDPLFIYLHGFASSPGSKKAQFFKDRLAVRGITLHIPDLNVPNFEHLTLSTMIARTAEEAQSAPNAQINLIGSSMGGLLALHFADRHREVHVSRLFLMAPAFYMYQNRRRTLGAEGMAAWKATGQLATYHYGSQQTRQLHHGLMDDMAAYDSFAVDLPQPMVIYHGRNDASVDYHDSERFAESRPNVTLRLVDSDHELLDQLEPMWAEAVRFWQI